MGKIPGYVGHAEASKLRTRAGFCFGGKGGEWGVDEEEMVVRDLI